MAGLAALIASDFNDHLVQSASALYGVLRALKANASAPLAANGLMFRMLVKALSVISKRANSTI